MDLHEYQAKDFLARYGITHPPFFVVESAEDAKEHLQSDNEMVVKVQVHAGGRGKAGGVKRIRGKAKVLAQIEKLIGFKMVNRQTGPEGVIAEKVMVTPSIDIHKEFYLAVVIDRKEKRLVVIASTEGGIDIEDVAENNPEKILTLPLFDDGKIRSFQALNLSKFMGWDHKEGWKFTQGLVNAFLEMDASLVEINPLVLMKEGNLIALDAKMAIDENALFRQKEVAQCEDLNQLPAAERKAREVDLAYIALEGNIGCMVNGAGLAMATMDMIQLYGGKPANFLDVGGGATQEKITAGFKLLMEDPQVKAILVNIFGGIMNCVTIAGGIIAAVSSMELKVPLVVRMEGTNVENGRAMLEKSGLPIIAADHLADAAEKVIGSIK
ncbi:ADP-forming succinate--CoA ligase subunit beta [Chlamydiales bacterium]|nr:ADP-forming succinate--CoA ligase subunit beta [Chlamydiales bacterium]